MKDLTKYFIDLSKCSEEQRKHIISLLPEKEFDNQYQISRHHFHLSFDEDDQWWVYNSTIGKTELTYPEFIKLFEGGEGENNGWIRVTESLPNALQTVLLSNGKGFTTIGCLAETEDGWHWAEGNGVVYEANGEIVSECESDDIEVNFWHPLPKAPKF